MPTVRAICVDALTELGVLGEGEDMTATQGARALLRAQNMIDGWQAKRLLNPVQLRTVFVLTSGTSTVTLGPTGGTVTMPRPVWIDAVNYLIPASSPAVESPIAIMGRDQYNALSIKALTSALPTQCFYQTSLDTVLGSLFFWPQVTQNVSIALYTPQPIGVPTTLASILTGPPGWQEAFMYQLAIRLVNPFGLDVANFPLLPGLAKSALDTIQMVTVMPGSLGVDAALVPIGGGYNVLTDSPSRG